MLDIVITMGGVGKRFRDYGYDCPKYMIEAKGKSLFEWSMISLKNYNEFVDHYIFVVKKDNKYDVEDFIKSKCNALGILDFKIITIDYLTDGQATTAMLAKEYINCQNGFMVYNIDTYIEPSALKYNDIKGDGFIPCFNADGNHWSFVKIDLNMRAVLVKEKERISDYCSIGLYYFKNFNTFSDAYYNYYSHKKDFSEKYIAPIYNYLIDNKKDVYINCINKDAVHVLGTPEEMVKFIYE